MKKKIRPKNNKGFVKYLKKSAKSYLSFYLQRQKSSKMMRNLIITRGIKLNFSQEEKFNFVQKIHPCFYICLFIYLFTLFDFTLHFIFYFYRKILKLYFFIVVFLQSIFYWYIFLFDTIVFLSPITFFVNFIQFF